MKSVISFLIIVGIAGAWADDFAYPDPSWATVLTKSNDSNDTDTCKSLYSCKDCSTARVCRPTGINGQFTVVMDLPCPKARPYCDSKSGSCVVTEPENCGVLDDFICMGNGIFPDLDCRKFHVCQNYAATTFQCAAEGNTYNPATKTCEKSTACGTFTCATNEVRKAPHDLVPGYFAFCNNANGPLVVDSCPPSFKLDVETQECEPDCKENGIIPDPDDCQAYYKCTQKTVGRGITYMDVEKKSCPSGQAYSTTEYICVDKALVKTCT